MIKSVEIKNFKAIEKAKVKLTPLTAFIGYNGTGKSSMLEALEMFKSIVSDGLDVAIKPWREFEHIYFKGEKTGKLFYKNKIKFPFSPLSFSLDLKADGTPVKILMSIAQEANETKSIFFVEEILQYGKDKTIRNADNRVLFKENELRRFDLDSSMITGEVTLRNFINRWQFLSMNTFLMGDPYSQKKSHGFRTLNKDGRNIAEYLLSIRELNLDSFNGILETLQYVLPYAKDLQPQITTELERMVFLQLSEKEFKLPGWVLSTGTLKLLALLSVLRHPEPAPLIVIEEIENGLDPRTINLIINEIREFVKDKKSQVIITTHSPYLLDLLHLSQVVFVERKDGNVVFNRPYDFEQLRNWSKDYTPGEMYRKDLIQQIIK
jgi:predicted ATPase